MSEYICAVTKAHKRSYGLPQTFTPQCCGKPMVPTQAAPQPMTASQPATVATAPQALWTREVATVPQKEKNWWQLWK